MSIKPEISHAERRIVHGVYVISTKHEDRINAMTAAWVARASFDPPLLTVAVGKTRFTHDLIKGSGVFAVNVLSPEAIATARHFGMKSGRKTDKFAGVDYSTSVTGSPILKDCIAWMDCTVITACDAGDHTLFIGEVLDGGVIDEEAVTLIYDKETFYK